MNASVCKQEDEFTIEQMRWLADLSNGETILQDDNRPGTDPPQAWLRLAEYCRQQNAHVVNLRLQFRSHHESPLSYNAPAYFFARKIGAMAFSGQTEAVNQDHFYLIGEAIPDKDTVRIYHFKVPEIILVDTEERPLSVIKPHFLICQKGYYDTIREKLAREEG